MDKFGKSQPVKRVEDIRFVTGAGRYVDDIAPEGALHAVFVRADVAHAEIRGIDRADAAAMDGVHLILTAEDLEADGVKLGMAATLVKNIDGSRAADPMRPVLAKGRVRFVGEPVAMVVADTLAQAREAAEAVVVDYAARNAAMDLAEGGPLVHDDVPGNLAFDWGMGDRAATQAAIDAAAHVVRARIEDNRIIVNSMEPRGCFAEWDGSRLHVCFGGQGVWGLKSDMAKHLGLDEDQVKITNPDVGGGFGMKGFSYPEYFPVAAAAKKLGRPVRWMSARTEAMMSDNSGRDLVSDCVLAFDAQHRITAYSVETLCNLGAYNSTFGQMIQTQLFSRVLMGTYDVQTTWLGVKGYYTNTTPVDAYRGAGRPEAIYALERMMDYAARALGVDAWDLRRKNFIPAASFPYKTATGETYDVGDFHRVLGKVEAACDRAGFAARKAASAKAGKLRGLGLCYYIESILGSPTENVQVDFREDGTVAIYVGTQSNGQGHETVFAQFLADQTGIPADRIEVIQGDSDLIPAGGGTGGSRSVTVQTNATLTAVAHLVTA